MTEKSLCKAPVFDQSEIECGEAAVFWSPARGYCVCAEHVLPGDLANPGAWSAVDEVYPLSVRCQAGWSGCDE
jgi:hypothetical protein